MKKIIFKKESAQKSYDDYFNKVKKAIKILSDEDKEDILMEINSHIYEGIQRSAGSDEAEVLLDVLSKLGPPEEMLKPMVADKKLKQASKSFNPKHILQALLLNIKNGVVYSLLLFIYILLAGLLGVVVLKIIYPGETGFFIRNGEFNLFGYTPSNEGAVEVLGNWFIPVVLVLIIVIYFITTFFLRLIRKK